MGSSDKRKLFLDYTALFPVFLFACVLVFLLIGGKTIVTRGDGISQQYPYFIYTGRYIREIFSNIFEHHIFELPMWDHKIGFGGDPLVLFEGEVLPDPFYWVSALVPVRFSYPAYLAVNILKLYVIGIAFIVFSLNKGYKNLYGILAGALIYVFSVQVYYFILQPNYLNLYYLFPFLLTGVERVWKGKGFKTYVISVALVMAYTFYYLYVMGMLVASYLLIRLIFERHEHNIKDTGKLVLKFILFTVLGTGIGCALQLPVIYNLSHMDRIDQSVSVSLFSLESMKKILLSYSSFSNIGGAVWGFSAVSVFAAGMLWIRKGKGLLKTLFVIYTASFFFPVVGSALNGFNYSSGRYVFGYMFLVAVIAADVFEDEIKPDVRKLLAGSVCASVYTLILFLTGYDHKTAVFLIIVMAVLFLTGKISDMRLRRAAFFMILLISTVYMSSYSLNRYIKDYAYDRGVPDRMILHSDGKDLMEDLSFPLNRYDVLLHEWYDLDPNTSMVTGRNGSDAYTGYYYDDLNRYIRRSGLAGNPGFAYSGLRGREFLLHQNGVLYLIRSREEGTVFPPYSFELISSDGEYELYRNRYEASIVHFYDQTLSYEDLDKMDPYDREISMLDYCITDESDASYVPSEETCYTVSEEDDGVLLTFEPVNECDVSLYIEDLRSSDESVGMFRTRVDFLNEGEVAASEYIVSYTPSNNYYNGKDSFLVSSGFTEDPVDSIRITFTTPGEYSYGSLRLYSRSSEETVRRLDAYYDTCDTDYSFGVNSIDLSVPAPSDGVLFIAVPYSDGWTCTVDGGKAPVMRANEAFMGVRLSPGDHEVRMHYSTPMLKEGIIISGLSWAVFATLAIISKKKKGHNEKA